MRISSPGDPYPSELHFKSNIALTRPRRYYEHIRSRTQYVPTQEWSEINYAEVTAKIILSAVHATYILYRPAASPLQGVRSPTVHHSALKDVVAEMLSNLDRS